MSSFVCDFVEVLFWTFLIANSLLNCLTMFVQINHNSELGISTIGHLASNTINNINAFLIRRSILSKQLVDPHLLRRVSTTTLPFHLRQQNKSIGPRSDAKLHSKSSCSGNPGKKPRCDFCPIRKNRFTQHRCSTCLIPICKEHTKRTTYICNLCDNNPNSNNMSFK